MESLIFKISAIGLAGIGAQWLAWRLRLPAIVLLLIAGLVLGPITGFVNPERDFGIQLRSLIALAVAIILFEGGLTLNFQEIRHTSTAVRRLVLIGAPLGWFLGSAAAHYVAGIYWPAAIILGGIFVVTGPTVIMPLLRQARLKSRPASLLRWEAIINDPLGALFAVLAFEYFVVQQLGHSTEDLVYKVGLAIGVALIGGFILGKIIVALFNRGLVPEYLKAPILLVAVLGAYSASHFALEESGLLTVTVMGLTIGNSRLASLNELKRFKEIMTVILVSGVFVLLTATIDETIVARLDWRAGAFVLVMLFVVRPITTWVATLGAGLSWQERVLIGWIAPRGVVAVAVATYFAGAMADISLAGGREMIAITFALVFSTVVLHGFTIGPLARRLGLAAASANGVLIVGGGSWTTGLAAKLKEMEIPVIIADNNWFNLRASRDANIPVFYGDILSEAAEHTLDLNAFTYLVAATDNDSYNTLVCNDFAFEFGRNNVFALYPRDRARGGQGVKEQHGGKALFDQSHSFGALNAAAMAGGRFTASRLSEQYSYDEYLQSLEEDRFVVLVVKKDGEIQFIAEDAKVEGEADDVVVSFG